MRESFKNSVSTNWIQSKITHYNSFILIGLQVMLPEQTILPQGVEGETLHQIISPLFDEYL